VKAAPGSDSYPDIDFLHEIGLGISAAPLAKVLGRIVLFVSSVTESDSCFIYIQDGRELVLRASKNLHSEVIGRLRIQVGKGITGWVAAHKKPVAIGRNAYSDPRFQSFNELPEDRYEAFLSVPVLCRGKLVGVINAQHCRPHAYTRREVQLISTIGFLVGAEIELARLEDENWKLTRELRSFKPSEGAKEDAPR
jgi:signal transduction protein with GAF and PtsI domain